MTLVDTTVWIDWLRGSSTRSTCLLDSLLEEGDTLLAPLILQEILQGAHSEAALKTLQRQFMALPMLRPDVANHAAAGALYARCRWQGITPRSPHDCLIAQLAIENDLPLLHADRDFEALARVNPKLRLLP
ncbi:MAG: PIN domain-containing protein [Gammaproteobacteria bacterium]